MILHLHHRYRTLGGEERAIVGLRQLTEERLGEPTALLERDSTATGAARAARGLLQGGIDPAEVTDAVHRHRARVVHAHNVHPTFGVRALHAAREAGARVVLHLHNYRLVCAIGTCVRDGHDCTDCHGRRTTPGVRHRCRGGVAETLVYAAGISRQQRALIAAADALVVPSRAALTRLRELGAPLPDHGVHVVPHPVDIGPSITPDPYGPAIFAGRLSPEKGVAVAIEAARISGRPLVVAGDGPLDAELRASARDLPHVRFVGLLTPDALATLRASASVELAPSLAHETFGLASAEAMLRGLPVVASDVGALSELVPDDARVPAGDPQALADAWTRIAGDRDAGRRQRDAARAATDGAAIADGLRAAYAFPA
ncbi:MAG: glycosyltransferase family 4 protein [Patulibacter sp.]